VRARSIVIAGLASATLASCGSSGEPSPTAAKTGSGSSSVLRFSQCMRANGVPDFPDPSPGGYRTTGINLQSPAAERAFNVCKARLNQSMPPPPVSARVRRQELEWAHCMRANGVPSFPDPDENGDIQLPIGSPIPQTPAFRTAQNGPCKQYASR
jgi:hypothetical protein